MVQSAVADFYARLVFFYVFGCFLGVGGLASRLSSLSLFVCLLFGKSISLSNSNSSAGQLVEWQVRLISPMSFEHIPSPVHRELV